MPVVSHSEHPEPKTGPAGNKRCRNSVNTPGRPAQPNCSGVSLGPVHPPSDQQHHAGEYCRYSRQDQGR
jgi:hypothetical protein